MNAVNIASTDTRVRQNVSLFLCVCVYVEMCDINNVRNVEATTVANGPVTE